MQDQHFRIFVNKQMKCKENLPTSNTDNGSKIDIYQEIMEMFAKFGLGHSVR